MKLELVINHVRLTYHCMKCSDENNLTVP